MSHTFKVNLLTLQICYIQTVSNIPLPVSVVFQDIGIKCKTNKKVHFILRIQIFIDTYLKKKKTQSHKINRRPLDLNDHMNVKRIATKSKHNNSV